MRTAYLQELIWETQFYIENKPIFRDSILNLLGNYAALIPEDL